MRPMQGLHTETQLLNLAVADSNKIQDVNVQQQRRRLAAYLPWMLVVMAHLALLYGLSAHVSLPKYLPAAIPSTAIHAYVYSMPRLTPSAKKAPTTTQSVTDANVTPARAETRNAPALATASATPANMAAAGAARVTNREHKAASKLKTAATVTSVGQPSMREISRQYIKQQQLQVDGKRNSSLFTAHSSQYATHENPNSMSEIRNKPRELNLPVEPLASRSGSLDLALDPNRIIKFGSTCYRVVKTPTQINPYAENLGFAFKCGQTDDEKLLNTSLKFRINQHTN